MSNCMNNDAPIIVSFLLFMTLLAAFFAMVGADTVNRDIAAKCDSEGVAAISGSAYRCERITHKAEITK